jgi:hypothetical protein
MDKLCVSCGERKPAEEFYPSARRDDGLDYYCQVCRLAKTRRYYKANGDAKKNEHLRRKYNLPPGGYPAMLTAQASGCAICGEPHKQGKVLHVDHCHVTEKVRGLLCAPCNTALGGFRDNEEFLLRAVSYLKGGGEVDAEYF